MAAVTERITIGQITTRFLIVGDEAAGSPSLFEFDVPAGARVPMAHSHDGYEETIYGLEGILGPDYFRDVAAVIDAAAGGPPDLAAMASVMRSHGLTPAP